MMKVLVAAFLFFTNYVFAQLPKFENGKLILDQPVTFVAASPELTDEGKQALKPVIEFLKQKEYITTLRIEGHTDNSGAEKENLLLSQWRALTVCKWLVQNGVDCKRLIAVGFGSTKPVAANDTPTNRAQNRRMEFISAAMRGKAIGGMPLDGGGVPAGDCCN